MSIIKGLEKEGKVYDASYDAVFKSIIQDEETKDYTAYIISSIDKRIIDKDKMIFVNTEGTKNSIADRINVHDIVIDIDSNRISLEMNKKNDMDIRNRNKSHFYEGASKAINISYRIGRENYYEQINFDYLGAKDKLISTYKRVDIDTGEEDIDEKNIIKYRVNMAKVFRKYYNEGEELTRFEKALAILSFSKIEDLRKIAKGDDMLMRVEKKIEELTKNPDLVRYIDDEAAMRFGHQQDIQIAVEKATKEVTDKVTKDVTKNITEKNAIETAKKMIKDGFDLDTISKYVACPKEKLEKLI